MSDCRQRLVRGVAIGLVAVVAVMCGITWAGGARAAERIVVPRDFLTIQAAVDAAGPGATIQVLPGTYTEQLVFAKNVTLRGSGVGATIIEAPPVLFPFAFAPSPQLPIVAVVLITDGADVSLSGLTVTGPIPCGVAAVGVGVVKAATLQLEKSRVTRIRFEDTTCSGPLIADGIDVGLSATVEIDGQLGTTGHATISDVAIDRYQRLGIGILAPPGETLSTALVSRNRITGGASPFSPVAQIGIALSGAILAQVEENIVTANACTFPGCGADPITQGQSVGIGSLGVMSGGSEIADNRVSDNDVGIYALFSPNCCTISANRLKDNRFFGIVIQNGDGATTGNTVKGGQVGIGVVADAVDTVGVLQGDKIQHTTVAPVQEIDCCGVTATAVVENN